MPGKAINPDETAMQLEIRDNILNNMNIAVYVSDLATNEILFANMALRQLLDNDSLTGRICWEALRNESKRCAFCRIPYLLKNPGQGCHWEMCSGDSHFLIYDNIIPWSNGRLAHLQCMMKIETNDNSNAK